MILDELNLEFFVVNLGESLEGAVELVITENGADIHIEGIPQHKYDFADKIARRYPWYEL